MNDAEIKSVIDGLDEITGYSCEQMSLFDNDVFIRKTAEDALSVIHELQSEQKKIVHCKDCRYNCWQHGHETPSFWTPCREIKPEGHCFCWCGAAKDGDQK